MQGEVGSLGPRCLEQRSKSTLDIPGRRKGKWFDDPSLTCLEGHPGLCKEDESEYPRVSSECRSEDNEYLTDIRMKSTSSLMKAPTRMTRLPSLK
jgi:hypothetical protein